MQGAGCRVLGEGCKVKVLGGRIWGKGFRVQRRIKLRFEVAILVFCAAGFVFRVEGVEQLRLFRLGSRISGFGFRVSSSGSQVSDFGFPVPGSGFWVPSFGFRVPGMRYRVPDFWFRGYQPCDSPIGSENGVRVRPPRDTSFGNQNY